jgi:hypothetical protein
MVFPFSEIRYSMIRKKPAPHLDSGVGTGFPLDKRGTLLRADPAQSKI